MFEDDFADMCANKQRVKHAQTREPGPPSAWVKICDFVCLFGQISDSPDPTLGPGGSFEHVQQTLSAHVNEGQGTSQASKEFWLTRIPGRYVPHILAPGESSSLEPCPW